MTDYRITNLPKIGFTIEINLNGTLMELEYFEGVKEAIISLDGECLKIIPITKRRKNV